MKINNHTMSSPNKESKIENKNLDNSKLIHLLEQYGKDPSVDNYKIALNEIITGDSLLILPSINEGENNDKWKTLKKDSKLKLTSVFDQDGLKVLGVFSALDKLIEWSNETKTYTAMNATDVIDFCQSNGIDRIVIDSGAPTMFVLERNQGNKTKETNPEQTKVRIGTPTHPIEGEHLQKFQTNFSNINSIKEVYQYAMIRNEEPILVLGFVLDEYTQESQTACIQAIQDAMQGQTLEMPLEMFILSDPNWYHTVKEIDNSLVYKRS